MVVSFGLFGTWLWLKAFMVCVCVTHVVLVRGPFDLVAGSYADAGGEGGFESDGESCERGGGEEGG
jgi:hypothetical protein